MVIESWTVVSACLRAPRTGLLLGWKNAGYSRPQSPNNRAHTRRSLHVVGAHEQQPNFNNGRARTSGDRDWTTSALSTLQILKCSIQTQNDSLLGTPPYSS